MTTDGEAIAGSLGHPTSFTATAASSTSVNLTWVAPANPSETGYTLSQSSGSLAGCSPTPAAGTTSCTATGLTGGTAYTWTLAAVDDNWTSSSVTANATTFAADGSGTTTVSPAITIASSTGNTFTFTYTAATGGLSNGEVDLAVPSSWTTDAGSAPGMTGGSAGYTTASGGGGTLAVSGNTIKVSGITLSAGGTLTITFGSGGGSSGVTAPSTAGSPYSFATTEKSTSGGTLTALSSSPSVTAATADLYLDMTGGTNSGNTTGGGHFKLFYVIGPEGTSNAFVSPSSYTADTWDGTSTFDGSQSANVGPASSGSVQATTGFHSSSPYGDVIGFPILHTANASVTVTASLPSSGNAAEIYVWYYNGSTGTALTNSPFAVTSTTAVQKTGTISVTTGTGHELYIWVVQQATSGSKPTTVNLDISVND